VPRTVRRDPAAQSAWSACAWARFRKSAVTPFVWQFAQNDASGMASPAALAFAGSFMIAIDLYSLPGPWQLSQSSGGLREACFVWDQEVTRCDPIPVRIESRQQEAPPVSCLPGATKRQQGIHCPL
jgi:hypothetical protein